MKKTISVFLYLMIVTGMIFSGCNSVKENNLDTAPPGLSVEFPEKDLKSDVDVDKEGEEVDTVSPSVDSAPPVINLEFKPEPEPEPEPEPMPALIEAAEEEQTLNTTMYIDGSYSASGAYQSPAGSESITLTLRIENDKVASLSVSTDAVNSTSQKYKERFSSGINGLVVGKNISELGSFSQVNGSSLTPSAFNQALNSVKSQALS